MNERNVRQYLKFGFFIFCFREVYNVDYVLKKIFLKKLESLF